MEIIDEIETEKKTKTKNKADRKEQRGNASYSERVRAN